jgi:hypothetical protein
MAVFLAGRRRDCWAAGEVSGQNRTFRECLATQGVSFVLAARGNDTVPAAGGRPRLARSLATQVPVTGRLPRRSLTFSEQPRPVKPTRSGS